MVLLWHSEQISFTIHMAAGCQGKQAA